MSAMVRRFLRISCVVGLVGLCGLALVSQIWGGVWSLPSGAGFVRWDQRGLFIDHGYYQRWGVPYRDLAEWSINDLLMPPHLLQRSECVWLFLPWWLLLTTLGLPMAIIGRLTRRRKVLHGFPIEPTAKPK